MEQISLPQLRSACDRILQEAVHNVRQKYRDDRYVRRAEAENSFERFLKSDRKLFLLLGDSGKGKTNLMCHYALTSTKVYPTLLITGMWREHSTESILDHVFERLKIDIGQELVDTWSFVRNLDDLIRQAESQFLVAIDGINETTDYQWVKNGFRELLSKCPDTIRFAVSSRTDSFRLHFQDSFWADYVYQEKDNVIEEKEDEQYEVALNAVARSRYERVFTVEQKKLIESALRDHRDDVRRAKTERIKRLSTGGSIFIRSFSDAEFAEARSKYGTAASLVDEALENCHDPLIFRFFADTIGQEAREVSDVFTVENAREYLNKHIVEVEAQGFARDNIYKLLYRIANDCRKQYRSHRDSVDVASLTSEDDTQLAERFVETGLLTWRQWLPDGRRQAIAFLFDRMLSFVLALEVSNGGETSIFARLHEIAGNHNPSVIDIHQCHYLLLLHDELRLDAPLSGSKDWISVFLKRPTLRGQVIQILPELKSWSADRIIAEVHSLLLDTTNERASHRRRRSIEQENIIDACANALSAVARKGNGVDVIVMVENLINGSLREEKIEAFFSLVRPIAVAFDSGPSRCIKLLEQVCESESETGENETRYRRYEDNGGLRILEQEIRSFPTARLPVVHQLVISQWATLRSLCAVALPDLFVTNSDEAKTLLSQLIDDNDNRVRTSIANIIPFLAEKNISVALDLCKKLIDDKDVDVRAALVRAAVTLTCHGETALDALLQGALGDESPAVRITLAQSTAEALSGSEVEVGVEKLLKSILEMLAGDQSSLVRMSVISSSERLLSKYLRMSITLMMDACKGNTPPALKRAVLGCLSKRGVLRDPKVNDVVDELATLLAKDSDYTVRIASIPLLVRMADHGNLRANDLLIELGGDPEVHVRLTVLQEGRTERCFSEIIPRIGKNVYIGNPRRKVAVCQWINALAVARIAELDRRDSIERFLRNVGIAGLLVPLIAFLGVKGWTISWLGYLEGGGSSADPRLSFSPILLGVLVAVMISHLQRWIDLHYYSHHAGFFFRRIWPYLIVPVVISTAAALVSLEFTTSQISLLIGIVTLSTSTLLSLSLTEYKYNRSSEQWFGTSAVWVIGIGYISGAFAGWFADVTKEGFYGISLLLCPVLLNLRIDPKLRGVLSRILGIGMIGSVLPLMAYFLNRSQWLVDSSSLFRWMRQNLSPISSEAVIIACIVLAIATFGKFLDDESTGPALGYGITSFLILFTVIWLLIDSPGEGLFAALLVAEAIGLIVVASSERWLLWRALLILCGSYLIVYEGVSAVPRPWLLPSVSTLVVGVCAIAWWVLPKEYQPYLPKEHQHYEPSSLHITILTVVAALPFLYGITTALESSITLSSLPQSVNSQAWTLPLSSALVGVIVSHLFFGLSILTQGAKRFMVGLAIAMLIVGGGSALYLDEKALLGSVVVLAIGCVATSTSYGLRIASFLPIVLASVLLPAGVMALAPLWKSVYLGYGFSFLIVLAVLMIVEKIRPAAIRSIARMLSNNSQEGFEGMVD